MSPAEDDPQSDDSLRSLIRMARDEFDEEPPAGLDALLMAAARNHAPAPPRPGVFERLRRWLGASMMNPAIAGAAALVMIGGTAGLLYMRDPQQRVAEPTVATREQMRTPPPPASEPSTGVATSDTLQPTVPSAPPGDPPPAPMPEVRRGKTAGVKPPEVKAPEVKAPEVKASAGQPADWNVEGQAGGDERLFNLEDRGGLVGVTTDMSTSLAVEEKPPSPRVDRDGEADVTETAPVESPASVPVTTGSTAAAGRVDNRSKAENLLRQARTAAKKKNCSPVKVMAKEARKLDATYYDASFKTDPDVKSCL